MRSILLLALLVLPPSAAQAAQTGAYTVEYTGYSHGFTVVKFSGTLKLTPTTYEAHVSFHTAGLAGMMVHADNDSSVMGSFRGDTAMPSVFEGTGHLHGKPRQTRLVYKDGNPTVELLSPPAEQERSLVPPAQTLHTIDTLSAVALVIRQVANTGKCEGSVATFDGRRLATQSVHTAGDEELPVTDRSVFAGHALRCDFEGTQLAGFMRDESEQDLRKPRYGTAWLATPLPNAPPVPVKVKFDNKILGQVTLYLTSVAGAG